MSECQIHSLKSLIASTKELESKAIIWLGVRETGVNEATISSCHSAQTATFMPSSTNSYLSLSHIHIYYNVVILKFISNRQHLIQDTVYFTL